MAEQIATDLTLMYRFAALCDLLHLLGGTKTVTIIDEFARWTDDELDYKVEAMNALTIWQNARDDPLERDPEIFPEFTTERVLTMEFLHGIPVVDVMNELRHRREGCRQRLHARGYDLDRIASNIVWNLLNQVYAIGVFHADLHPANILLLPHNQIGYVDFGITGRLSGQVRSSLALYASHLFSGDVDGAIAEFARWVTPSSGTSGADAFDEMKRVTRRFLYDQQTGAAARHGLTADYQVAILSVIRRNRMQVNSGLLAYLRTILTVDSVAYVVPPSTLASTSCDSSLD